MYVKANQSYKYLHAVNVSIDDDDYNQMRERRSQAISSASGDQIFVDRLTKKEWQKYGIVFDAAYRGHPADTTLGEDARAAVTVGPTRIHKFLILPRHSVGSRFLCMDFDFLSKNLPRATTARKKWHY